MAPAKMLRIALMATVPSAVGVAAPLGFLVLTQPGYKDNPYYHELHSMPSYAAARSWRANEPATAKATLPTPTPTEIIKLPRELIVASYSRPKMKTPCVSRVRPLMIGTGQVRELCSNSQSDVSPTTVEPPTTSESRTTERLRIPATHFPSLVQPGRPQDGVNLLLPQPGVDNRDRGPHESIARELL